MNIDRASFLFNVAMTYLPLKNVVANLTGMNPMGRATIYDLERGFLFGAVKDGALGTSDKPPPEKATQESCTDKADSPKNDIYKKEKIHIFYSIDLI